MNYNCDLNCPCKLHLDWLNDGLGQFYAAVSKLPYAQGSTLSYITNLSSQWVTCVHFKFLSSQKRVS